MKVEKYMIDKELRTVGRLFGVLNNTFTETRLRFFSKFKIKQSIRDSGIEVTEEYIARKDGSKLRICIFKPRKAINSVPGILWIHGGGYAIGSPEESRITIKRFIDASDCVVVAPDYRLSVEAPYPAALEDCYDALLWMKSHCRELGIRGNQLMVGGDSAGGGLTAAITLYARDKKEVAIAFQMPLYPMIDDRMTNESARDNNAPIWNSESNYNGWKLYLGQLFGTTEVPYYAAPARVEEFSGLPPAVTFVGDLEPFRDETVQYVEGLRKAGVPVEFELFKGCYHAFEQMCPKAKVSKRAIAFLINAYKHAAKNYFAEQPNSCTTIK